MALSKADLAALIPWLAECSRDPLLFVQMGFPWGKGELEKYEGPDEWQKGILEDVRDGLLTADQALRIAVASGHGIGKSALVAWLILWALSTMEDTKGVVTANTENQLKTKTWAELAKWHRLFLGAGMFQYTATAIFSTDDKHSKTWRIDMVPWSEKNTEAFAGLHNQGKRLLLVFDEASAIPDVIWEVSEGALTDTETEIMWFCFGNPTRNTGRFRECFRKYRHRWKTQQIDSRTAKMTNKKQIQEWIDDYGEDSDFVKVRVRGLFPNASFKQFISSVDVDKGYGKTLRLEQYNFAPTVITVDPSWEGDDELVIAKRQGLWFTILKVIPKNDNDIAVAHLIAQYEDEYKADAVFIDGGFGTGIVSAGRTMRRNWTIVWFSAESPDAGCLNLRAHMWKQARDWFKAGGIIPEDPVLYEELTSIETVPRADMKIQLESKKEYKKRLGRSPNRADALVISFAYPVKRRNPLVRLGGQLVEVPGAGMVQRANTQYDRFNRR